MERPFVKNGVLYLPELDSATIDQLAKAIDSLSSSVSKKQPMLIAGDGIDISEKGVISCYGYSPEAKRSIKILMVGNSYARDAVSYIAPLVRELLPNIEVTIGIIHNDGASLQDYHEGRGEGDDDYPIGIFTKGTAQVFDYYKNLAWQWKKSNYPIADAFALEKWDIVTFQQRSNLSKEYSTYQPYLRQNINTIREYLSHPCKIGFLMGMPRRTTSDKKAIEAFMGQAEACQRVLEESACDFIIPCGTSIQNLRTIASMETIGTDTWLQSGGHLCTGLGMLTEGYTFILWISKLMGLANGVYGSAYRPKEGDARVTRDGAEPLGITEENVRLAQIAASYAIKNPFEITDMNNEVDL